MPQKEDRTDRIARAYSGLSPAEKKAADYLLANPAAAVNETVGEFSRLAGISEATAVRFCRKLGYRGFRDFCVRFDRQEAAESYLDFSDLSGELPSAVDRIVRAETESMLATSRALDPGLLRAAADRILKARNVLFVGMATSGTVCMDACQRLLRCGINARCYADFHNSLAAAELMGKEDAVVGISHSGATYEVRAVLACARARGAVTIGITSCPGEAISEVSDLLFRTVTRENPAHRIAVTSRMSQLVVIDALFAAIMEADGEVKQRLVTVSDSIRKYAAKGREK